MFSLFKTKKTQKPSHCSTCSKKFRLFACHAKECADCGRHVCRDCAVSMRMSKKKIKLCFECCGTLTSRRSRPTITTIPSETKNTLVLSPPQAVSQNSTRPCKSILSSTVVSDLDQERELLQQGDACLTFLDGTQEETTPTTTVAVVTLFTPEPFQSLPRRLSFQDCHERLPLHETAFRSCRARLVTTKESVRGIQQQGASTSTTHHQVDLSTAPPEGTRETKCSEPMQESKKVALESPTTHTLVQNHDTHPPICSNDVAQAKDKSVVESLSSSPSDGGTKGRANWNPNDEPHGMPSAVVGFESISSDDVSSRGNSGAFSPCDHQVKASKSPDMEAAFMSAPQGSSETTTALDNPDLVDKSPPRPESTKNKSATTKTNSTLGSSSLQRQQIGRHHASYRRELDTYGWPSMSHAEIKMDLLVGCPLGYLPPI